MKAELKNTNELFEKIKSIIALKITHRKVIYKDVAKELKIGYDTVRMRNIRNITPYEQIIIFCQKNNVCLNEMFLK